MRRLNILLTGVFTVVVAMLFLVNVAVSQDDLSQKKQEKMIELQEIDNKLNASPSKEEYEALMAQREKVVAEIKEIDKKLKADVEAMKRINAVKKAYNEGNTAYRLGQYDQAVSNYNKAISMDSTFFKAYYGKGLALKRQRKYREAIKAYQGAVRHNPAYTEAYIAMGKIYSSRLGAADKAIETYKNAIEHDPSSHKAFYELGAVYQNMKKDYRKAVENFQKATQLKNDYDLAFFSLGVSLTELARYDQAVVAFENALAFTNRKNWEDPHARLAVVYNKQGECSKALEEAKLALEIQKNDALASYEAGKASKCLGQYNQAISYFENLKSDRQWRKVAEYEIDLIVNRDKYGGNN